MFREFKDEAAFREAKKEKEVWAVFRGRQEGELFKMVRKMAEMQRKGKIAFSTIDDGAEPSFTLYRNFEEPEVHFEGQPKELKKFVDIQSVPHLFEFNRETKGRNPKVLVPRLYMICDDQS